MDKVKCPNCGEMIPIIGEAVIEHLAAKDYREAAKNLSLNQVRYLVDFYYLAQENRKRADNQILALEKSGEPADTIKLVAGQSRKLEEYVRRFLTAFVEQAGPVADWCMSIKGIGPIITAGLLSHINLEPWSCTHVKDGRSKKPCKPSEPHGPECHFVQIKTVSPIYRFAGLDPSMKWEKGQKRPWNASLKTLCWKIGESFVKVSGNPDSLYGRLYLERKAMEAPLNEAGGYLEQAEAGAKRVKKTTKAYKSYAEGKLPDGHLHARAKRYAVKIFLSHLQAQMYREHYGEDPPKPYPIAILGHAHEIMPEARP